MPPPRKQRTIEKYRLTITVRCGMIIPPCKPHICVNRDSADSTKLRRFSHFVARLPSGKETYLELTENLLVALCKFRIIQENLYHAAMAHRLIPVFLGNLLTSIIPPALSFKRKGATCTRTFFPLKARSAATCAAASLPRCAEFTPKPYGARRGTARRTARQRRGTAPRSLPLNWFVGVNKLLSNPISSLTFPPQLLFLITAKFVV